MIGKNLLVRDLEAFLKSTSEQLRSDESKIREEEREVVMKLMIVKRNDERRKLRELQREKESLRRIIQEKYGRKKCYDLCVKYLRKEVRHRRTEMRDKYEKKIKHLSEVRQKELDECNSMVMGRSL